MTENKRNPWIETKNKPWLTYYVIYSKLEEEEKTHRTSGRREQMKLYNRKSFREWKRWRRRRENANWMLKRDFIYEVLMSYSMWTLKCERHQPHEQRDLASVTLPVGNEILQRGEPFPSNFSNVIRFTFSPFRQKRIV